MNVNGWLIAWGLGMSLVTLVFALLYVRGRKWRAGYDDLMHENKQLERERNDARAQRARLNTELANVKGELARFQKDNEQYVDVIAELTEKLRKSVDHATVPLDEVKPVKRPVRRKESTA